MCCSEQKHGGENTVQNNKVYCLFSWFVIISKCGVFWKSVSCDQENALTQGTVPSWLHNANSAACDVVILLFHGDNLCVVRLFHFRRVIVLHTAYKLKWTLDNFSLLSLLNFG